MKLLIEISEEVYNKAKETHDVMCDSVWLGIKYGTPLPKRHGRLIDADSLDIPVNICNGFEAMDYIDGADTIIEADKAERSDKC